ncbi:MAG: hypothetical protein ACFCBW_17800, partial [Candidatus Competibacterales bacterium]
MARLLVGHSTFVKIRSPPGVAVPHRRSTPPAFGHPTSTPTRAPPFRPPFSLSLLPPSPWAPAA